MEMGERLAFCATLWSVLNLVDGCLVNQFYLI